MQINSEKYQAYTKILEEELVPAMGCTEPIAIAYCAAIMKDTLGNIPEKIDVYVANNLKKSCQNLDEDEFINVEKMDVNDLIEMIYEGKIEDSKTIASILAYYKKYCMK